MYYEKVLQKFCIMGFYASENGYYGYLLVFEAYKHITTDVEGMHAQFFVMLIASNEYCQGRVRVQIVHL